MALSERHLCRFVRSVAKKSKRLVSAKTWAFRQRRLSRPNANGDLNPDWYQSMIFPNIAIWGSSDPADPAGRIDRALDDRNHRLSAGLSVTKRFHSVRGALVVSQGNGKYIRLRHVVEASSEIPKPIREGCLQFLESEKRQYEDLAPLLADLSEIQAAVVEKLKCEAGKYVDRVLAVSVCDPGVWSTDFDGKVSYRSMCDANRLAELSGVSVIDSLPARDLTVGGTGRNIEALPYWMMFADRNPRVANRSRGLIVLGETGLMYTLPASDGLDSEVPEIRMTETIGFQFLDALTRKYFPADQNLSHIDRLYADGLEIPELRSRWEKVIADLSPGSQREATSLGGADFDSVADKLVAESDQYLNSNSDSFSNLIRTGISWVIELVFQDLTRQSEVSVGQLKELFVSCSPQYEASVINLLDQRFPGTNVASVRKLGVASEQMGAVVAAVLGLFHIDQMPANVPWLTGARSQRILGRLTPGRPSNWRQLLRVMADFHPAPMKLKDAI